MEETETEPTIQNPDPAPSLFGETETVTPAPQTEAPARETTGGQPSAGKGSKKIKLRRKPVQAAGFAHGNDSAAHQTYEQGQSSEVSSQASAFAQASPPISPEMEGVNPTIDVATAAALERETRNGFVRKQESFDRLINERQHENGKQEHTDSRARLLINDLSKMGIKELRDLGSKYGINHDELIALRKQELIFYILKSHTDKGGIIYAYGSLEILPDGYGFLRSPQNSYLSGTDDIYISPSQIRLFNLKTGDTVYGQIRSPKEGERFFAMLRIELVNFDEPAVAQNRIPFENLTPLYPNHKLDLETTSEELSTRIINLFCPIGKGQRALIVSPPKTGKTVLLQ